jgi:RimJ/RimL family protein N-acetyltransferase
MLIAPSCPVAWPPASTTPLVRRATAEDVVALAALKRRVERLAYAHLGTAESLSVRLHRRCTAWYLLGRLAEGELLLVNEEDDVLLGMAAARVDRTMTGPTLHLHSAAVAHPGRGLGSALTRARLEAAAALGIRRVTADCMIGAHGATERMQRMGLSQVGQTRSSNTFPGVRLSHWSGSVHTALTSLPVRPPEELCPLTPAPMRSASSST